MTKLYLNCNRRKELKYYIQQTLSLVAIIEKKSVQNPKVDFLKRINLLMKHSNGRL